MPGVDRFTHVHQMLSFRNVGAVHKHTNELQLLLHDKTGISLPVVQLMLNSLSPTCTYISSILFGLSTLLV